jgi:class 3 adenylate cyclase
MSQDYYVVGIDVMAYSEKELSKQVYAQDLLDRTLAAALDQHTALKDRIWIDGGDGGYLLLVGDAKEVVNLLETFLIRLANENRNLNQDSRAFVRCAIHYDAIDIRSGKLGQKYTGNAINICARLLVGMPRKPDQVVCSAKFRTILTRFNNHVETIIAEGHKGVPVQWR